MSYHGMFINKPLNMYTYNFNGFLFFLVTFDYIDINLSLQNHSAELELKHEEHTSKIKI